MSNSGSIGSKKVKLEIKQEINVTHKRYKTDINKVDFDNCKLNESMDVDWFSPPVDGSPHSTKWSLRLFPKGVDKAIAVALGQEGTNSLSDKVVIFLNSPVKQKEVLKVTFSALYAFRANKKIFPQSYSDKIDTLLEKSRNGEAIKKVKQGYNFSELLACKKNKVPFHKNKTSLVIDIIMVVEENDMAKSEQIFQQNSNLLNAMKTISGLDELHDFTIICGEEEISCHKTVLAARSEILKAMLVGDTLERQENKVIFKDSTPKLVKVLVKHMYDGETPENINELAIDLIYLAVKYQVHDLIKACQEALIENLTDENAIATLIIVDRFVPQSSVRAKVLKFMTNHATKVIKSKDMGRFAQMYPVLVIELCSSMAQKLDPAGKP